MLGPELGRVGREVARVKVVRVHVQPDSGFRHDEAGFMPFSVGPMNCMGKTLAMQEMQMVLCVVLSLQQFAGTARTDLRPTYS